MCLNRFSFCDYRIKETLLVNSSKDKNTITRNVFFIISDIEYDLYAHHHVPEGTIRRITVKAAGTAAGTVQKSKCSLNE